jgi:tRNA threonylcarbamoyladenosine biosynthesis protein TsaB
VRVLAVDTSTPAITAGVVEYQDGTGPTIQLVAERTRNDAFGHAEHLMPLVRAALADAGLAVADVDAVVVGLGPGPFTGLRVGIATAAALGDGLAVPVHGVPSHDAMAVGLGDVLIATDARRREVHLSAHSAGAVVAGPVPIKPAAVAGWLAEQPARPTAVSGSSAELVAPLVGLPAVSASGSLSEGLVRTAAAVLLAGRPAAPLSPLYLRRPDATEPTAPKAVLPG